MPAPKTTNIFSRQHEIAAARFPQIELNQLAVDGGRDYVGARLWRAPNESNLSWSGKTSITGAGMPGRLQRAALVADAQRIARKINDYIFSEDAVRDPLDEEFLSNVDGSGTTVRQFFETVSESITSGQWCWLQVDRGRGPVDADGNPIQRTLAERRGDASDRPRWTVWPATSVPDWYFQPDGRLGWIITAGRVYDNSDPTIQAVSRATRTLWQRDPAGCIWTTYEEGKKAPVDSGRLSIDAPPFVLVGEPSAKGWWMDNVEAIQAQLLNLDSLHTENLVRTVFPQLVIPASMLEAVEVRLRERLGSDEGAPTVEAVREIVRGLDSPFVENSDDKNITRFLMPDASDIQAIPQEITRKRALLFENVGLSRFFSESKQIQSAEGQRLGLQDINSTLKHRALLLQDAENELVGVTTALDTEFRGYRAEWNKTFDIHDREEDAKILEVLHRITRDPDTDAAVRATAERMLSEL